MPQRRRAGVLPETCDGGLQGKIFTPYEPDGMQLEVTQLVRGLVESRYQHSAAKEGDAALTQLLKGHSVYAPGGAR